MFGFDRSSSCGASRTSPTHGNSNLHYAVGDATVRTMFRAESRAIEAASAPRWRGAIAAVIPAARINDSCGAV